MTFLPFLQGSFLMFLKDLIDLDFLLDYLKGSSLISFIACFGFFGESGFFGDWDSYSMFVVDINSVSSFFTSSFPPHSSITSHPVTSFLSYR